MTGGASRRVNTSGHEKNDRAAERRVQKASEGVVFNQASTAFRVRRLRSIYLARPDAAVRPTSLQRLGRDTRRRVCFRGLFGNIALEPGGFGRRRLRTRLRFGST